VRKVRLTVVVAVIGALTLATVAYAANITGTPGTSGPDALVGTEDDDTISVRLRR